MSEEAERFGKASGPAQAHDRIEPAARCVLERDRCGVCLCELLHDGKTDARAAAARPGTPEAVERARPFLRRHATTLIANPELDGVGRLAREHGHGRARGRDVESV